MLKVASLLYIIMKQTRQKRTSSAKPRSPWDATERPSTRSGEWIFPSNSQRPRRRARNGLCRDLPAKHRNIPIAVNATIPEAFWRFQKGIKQGSDFQGSVLITIHHGYRYYKVTAFWLTNWHKIHDKLIIANRPPVLYSIDAKASRKASQETSFTKNSADNAQNIIHSICVSPWMTGYKCRVSSNCLFVSASNGTLN